jgi:predicted acetyltransferase
VKIIERNGGVLEDKIMVGTRPAPTRRYWIEL